MAEEIELSDALRRVSEPAYHLADEPWIPVTTTSGEVAAVGLRELFLTAHTVSDVGASTAPERWALLYLVQQLFIDLVGFTGMPPGAVPTALDAGAVGAYFDTVHNRLWLHHPDDPFLQQSVLPHRLAKRTVAAGAERVVVPTHSVKALEIHLGSGESHTWWEHVPDAGYEVDTATAARLLLLQVLMGQSGNVQSADGYRTEAAGLHGHVGNGNGLLLVRRQGLTLLESLTANTCRADLRALGAPGSSMLASADLTSVQHTWRPPDELSLIERRLWTPKARLLLPEAGGRVRRVLRGPRPVPPEVPGDKEDRKSYADLLRQQSPHVLTRIDGDGVRKYVWGQQDKEPWRELPALSTTYGHVEPGQSVSASVVPPEAGAFDVDSQVETLALFCRGTPTQPVVDHWVSSSIDDFFLADIDVLDRLAAVLADTGAVALHQKALAKLLRTLASPEADAGGRVRPRASKVPRFFELHMSRFWGVVRDLMGELAAELSQDQRAGRALEVPESWYRALGASAGEIAEDAVSQALTMAPMRLTRAVAADDQYRQKVAEIGRGS